MSKRPLVNCEKGSSRTKQCFKDECDINKIMMKYRKTGILTDLIKTNPYYGDFSHPADYLEAIAIVRRADMQFNSLNAHIRNRFKNDPELFLEFVTNPDNKEEMRRLGLLKPEPISPDGAKVNDNSDINNNNVSDNKI